MATRGRRVNAEAQERAEGLADEHQPGADDATSSRGVAGGTATEQQGTTRSSTWLAEPTMVRPSAPYLDSLTPEGVADFRKKRKVYVREVEGVQGVTLRPLTNSISDSALRILLLTTRQGEVAPADATDQDIDRALREFLAPPNALEDVDPAAIMREKLKAEKGVRLRPMVSKLLQDHEDLLEEHGLTGFREANPKACIKHILAALPAVFRKRLELDLSVADEKRRKDFDAFIALAYRVGAQEDRHNEAEAAVAAKKKPQKKTETKSGEKKHSSKKKKPGPAKPPPEGGCHICGGPHWKTDCPQAPKGGQGKPKSGGGAAAPAARRVETRQAPAPDPVAEESAPRPEQDLRHLRPGLVDGALPATFQLDSGCDHTVMPFSMIQELEQMGRRPRWYRTDQEYAVSTADEDLPPLRVVARAVLHLEIQKTSVGGRCTIHSANVWCVEGGLRDILLGRAHLRLWGYDLDAQFDQGPDELPGMVEEPPLGGRLARLLASGPVAEDVEAPRLDDGDPVPDMIPDLGPADAAELVAARAAMVDRAREAGASEEFLTGLGGLLEQTADLWRLRLGADPPAEVPPMRVRLRPGAEPHRARARRYAPAHREFLRREMDKHVHLGLAYRNPRSRWSTSPFLVPKRTASGEPPPDLLDRFRMTQDLRPVNQLTEDPTWPMPNLEVVLGHLQGMGYFGALDLFKGYWQFPLAEDCQEIFTLMTDEGCFTPRRVPMGAKGAVAYFQSTMQEVLGDLLYTNVLLWLDDVLVYAATEEGLLDALRRVFGSLEARGIRLHAGKCSLYSRTMRWCGRIVSAQGVEHDPARIAALQALPPPRTAADLQQLLCAANWMRAHLPRFAHTVAPLQELLEAAYSAAGGRTARKAAKVLLETVGWGSQHEDSLAACKELLSRATQLAHPRADREVCVFPDASLDFWGAAVTQVPPSALRQPLSEQPHEPLAFLSGAFKGAQTRWPIVEKEAFAIVETCCRLEYLLLRPGGFQLFTDHRNLAFIFAPEGGGAAVPRHTAAKLQRWAVLLMGFDYRIQHIPGAENVWGDLLSRWGAERPPPPTPSVRVLFVTPLSHTQDPGFQWPTPPRIAAVQQAHMERSAEPPAAELEQGAGQKPPEMTPVRQEDGLWRLQDGRIWIPDDALELQLRLCVIAHAGAAGHRGLDATAEALATRFYWPTLRADVQALIRGCLHCLATTGGNRVPRPLGEAVHAEGPNEVIHMDFLFIKRAPVGPQYVHVLKDDATGFLQLTTSPQPTAEATVQALEQWGANFGIPGTWVSDGGSHYKNQVVAEVQRRYGAHHHIVVAYSPWANGTVEVMNRELLRVFRALHSELRVPRPEWPNLVPLVQAALNQAPSAKLGGRAPVEAFTGLRPTRPLDSLLRADQAQPRRLDLVQLRQQAQLAELEKARDQLHKEVLAEPARKRDKRRKQVNAAKERLPGNFIEGDYVLVAHAVRPRGDKLVASFLGPKRITRVVNAWVYEVEDLLTQARQEVHATRLKYYADHELEVTAELLRCVGHNQVEQYVAAIKGHRFQKQQGQWELLIRWQGFEPDEDTWEPAGVITEDVPDLVAAYLVAQGAAGEELRRELFPGA